MSRHVKIRSNLFLNDFDGLLAEESSTGRLYIRTFCKKYFPEDVANLSQFIEVAGGGPIYDEFMSQVGNQYVKSSQGQIIKFKT